MSFLAQIVATKLLVVDEALLRWRLDEQQITYLVDQSSYTWAYQLIRAGASQIDDVSRYGLQLVSAFRETPLKQLRLLIDEEFYQLSRAHYERYFELDRSRVKEILENN